MKIQAIINGKTETLTVREFLGMYQILSGNHAMGLLRKDEVL